MARVVRVSDLMSPATPNVVWPLPVESRVESRESKDSAAATVAECFHMGQVEAVLRLERDNVLTQGKALKALRGIINRYGGEQ